MSTTGTKHFLEQQIAQDQWQLVERGLVVEQATVLFEQFLGLGRKDVDVALELA